MTDKFRGQYRVESTRLKDWDYSKDGAYFITICTKNRECCLGEVKKGEMHLNDCGNIVNDEWIKTKQIRNNVQLDEYKIMPNHVHGVIIIDNDGERNGEYVNDGVETIHELSLQSRNRIQRRNMLIPKIIGRFKMRTAKLINQYQKTEGIPFWQKNYYDHIIRNENELNRIRKYIVDNPIKWDSDRNNPENLYM